MKHRVGESVRLLVVGVAVLFAQGGALAEPAGQAVPAAAAAAPAAPSQDVQNFLSMSLEELLSTPVYAASRHEQSRGEVPAFVTVITAEDIKRHGYQTIPEILASVCGLYVSNDRNYFYLGVRGFSRPGDYNCRVLMLVNGRRVNDNIFDGAEPTTARDMFIDVDLIERIEIVRGPSSSMYGTSAMLAVINVVTRTGESVGGVEASGSYGSYDVGSGRLSYGERLPSGLDILVSGTLGWQGGQPLYYAEYDSPATGNGRTSAKADSGSSQNLYFRAAFKGLTFQAGFSEHIDRIPTGAFGMVFNDSRSQTADTYAFGDVQYEQHLAEHWDATWHLAWDKFTYKGDYPFDYSAAQDLSDIIVNKDLTDGEWWTGEFRVLTDVVPRNKISAGTEYRLNTRQDLKNWDEGYEAEPYVDLHNDSALWAVFAQDDIRLAKSILLTAGLRYDDYDTFGSEVNPRGALIFQPLDRTSLKFLYGEAFRAPNTYELFWVQSDVQKGNPNLRPETMATYEAVLEQRIASAFVLTLSAFEYRIEDLINLTVDETDGLRYFDNLAEAKAKGLECELFGKFSHDVSIRTGYTFTDAEDGQTGERLSNSPEHMAKVNLSAPLLTPQLVGAVELQYMGKRLSVYGTEVDDYVLTNISLLSRGLCKDLELSFGIYNAFDITYADPGSEEHLQPQIEQDGRTFRGKLTYRF